MKDKFKNPLKIIYLIKIKQKTILVEWGWNENFLNINPMGEHITEGNTTSYNVIYLVDNKKCRCKHEKLHPLTDRRVKCISETMYTYIEK